MADAVSQLSVHLRSRPMSRFSIVTIMAAFDAIVMALCLWFAAYAVTPDAQFAAVAAGGLALLCGVLAAGFNILLSAYRPRILTTLKASTWKGTPGVLLLICLSLLMGLAQGPVFEWVLLCLSIVAPFAILLRVVAQAFVRWAKDFGALERRAIIAGGGPPVERVIRALTDRPDNDVRIVAIFDDRNDGRSPAHVLGVPTIGRFIDVLRFVSVAEIDLVLVTLPLEAEERINEILAIFKALPHQVHLVDYSKDLSFEKAGNIGLVVAQRSSFDLVRRWQKRGFDIVFASLALILCAPVMALAAIAIRLETPGPVLFTQMRHGFANREIPVLKFRSMYHDKEDAKGTDVVRRGGDRRVTRVGAVLRKTSLDELPQLLCVLRGDLSLVGPRPHALDARSTCKVPFSQLVEDYALRHRLPPGVTGWAQVNGFRGGIDDPELLRERVAHDLYYIENWTIWFDLGILLRTPWALLDTRNAY